MSILFVSIECFVSTPADAINYVLEMATGAGVEDVVAGGNIGQCWWGGRTLVSTVQWGQCNLAHGKQRDTAARLPPPPPG